MPASINSLNFSSLSLAGPMVQIILVFLIQAKSFLLLFFLIFDYGNAIFVFFGDSLYLQTLSEILRKLSAMDLFDLFSRYQHRNSGRIQIHKISCNPACSLCQRNLLFFGIPCIRKRQTDFRLHVIERCLSGISAFRLWLRLPLSRRYVTIDGKQCIRHSCVCLTAVSGEEQEKSHVYTIGGLELNEETVEVTVDGEAVKLTPMEFKIVQLLIKNPGRVFSADEIYERIWNEKAVNTDTIMVHVRNIREKIEIDPRNPKYLKVVWGVGYKIDKQ